MNRESFESRLRNQLEGHEVAAPEGLWEQIEQALPHPDAPAATERKAATRRLFTPRRVAAAVVVMLIGGASWMLMNRHQGGTEREKPLAQHTEAAATGNDGSPVVMISDHDNPSPAPVVMISDHDKQPSATAGNHLAAAPSIYNIIKVRAREESEQASTALPPLEQAMPETRTDTTKAEPTTPKETTSDKPRWQPRDDRRPNYGQPTTPPTYELERHIRANRREPQLMASLSYTGTANAAHVMRSPVRMSDAMYNQFNSYGNSNALPETDAQGAKSNAWLIDFEEHTEYYFPTKVGLSVAYGIGGRWAVHSGLTYMRHQTDFVQKMPGTRITTTRKYDYVGIPLQLSYNLIDMKWGTLYVKAGGEADFNVKAREHMEDYGADTEKDKPQFSVGASAGIELRPLPKVGFYVEPGWNWYIDNGSSVDTQMKDKPQCATLQFGIRYTIK